MLSGLKEFTFGFDGRRDNDLRQLEFPDVLSSDRPHARLDRPDEILGSIVQSRGSEENFLQRAGYSHFDTCAARQVVVRRRHTPMKSLAGALLGAGESRSHDHAVGAASERFANVSPRRHAAIGDDRDEFPAARVVKVAGRGGIGRRGDLRHAEPQHAARRAGGARADANEQSRDAGGQEFQTDLIGHAIAQKNGHGHIAAELRDV